MNSKLLVLIFILCLILCGCSNDSSPETDAAGTASTTVPEATGSLLDSIPSVEKAPTIDSDTNSSEIPSLTVPQETEFLPTLPWMDNSDEPLNLPVDEFTFANQDVVAVPVTPTTESASTEATTQPESAPDSIVLPDDIWED